MTPVTKASIELPAFNAIPFNSHTDHGENDMAFPGYHTAAWRRVRAEKLRQQPCCEWCGASGPGLHVDHVVAVKDRPDRWADLDGLRVLCPSCHNRRSHRDGHRGRKARPVFQCGADGFPVDPGHPWNRREGSS